MAINHVEDLVLVNGANGARTALAELNKVCANVETVGVKYDGFPSVVIGRDSTGCAVFVDKYMFNKGILLTIREYDTLRNVTRKELWSADDHFRPLLESVLPACTDTYWTADLMWSGAILPQEGNYNFTPNTVDYTVRSSSMLGQHISRSKGGLALHSAQSLSPAGASIPLTNATAKDNTITFLSSAYTGYRSTLNVQLADIAKAVSYHYANVDEFFQYLATTKSRAVQSAMGPFITQMINEGDVSTDVTDRFLDFLPGRLSQPAYDRLVRQDGWLVNEGYTKLDSVWAVWSLITQAKTNVKVALDSNLVTDVNAAINNATGHEGYVVAPGNVKIVDRLAFSKANFANYKELYA